MRRDTDAGIEFTPVWHGKFESMWTVDEARESGRRCGLSWDEGYTPGGLHVLRLSSWERKPGDFGYDPDWAAHVSHSQDCGRVWMEGWRAGIAERDALRSRRDGGDVQSGEPHRGT